MLGVIIGILLLLFLVALVVLQGMIEWGGFDIDKVFGKKAKPEEIAKEEIGAVKKTKVSKKKKPAAKAKKAPAKKKKKKGKR